MTLKATIIAKLNNLEFVNGDTFTTEWVKHIINIDAYRCGSDKQYTNTQVAAVLNALVRNGFYQGNMQDVKIAKRRDEYRVSW